MSSNKPTERSAVTRAAHGAAPAHPLHRFLHLSSAELADEATRIPEQMYTLASAGGSRELSPQNLVDTAEGVFGIKVVGDTLAGRAARVRDVGYWRRTLRRHVAREAERIELQRGRVGKDGSAYCSERAQHARTTQRKAQQQWLEETTLQAVIDGEPVELSMETVAKTPHQKLSRLYAFVAAMDQLAVESELTVALLTATLESEWHPNPAHGKPGHRWNGATPAQASDEFGKRWQRVRRDLGKRRISVSGLWAAEPHRDGCPHRHFWLIYDPEHQDNVFAAFLKHFPGKMKVRRDEGTGGDVMIETAADARAGVSRPLKRKREGAQVDVSIIDRDKGSGATYVIKYVSKSIGAEGAFDGEAAKPKSEREQRNLLAIDAYRALWGMRAVQFFGINDCLTKWDELRRAPDSPQEPELAALWRAARGGEATGRIDATQQRGDACEFLRLQGGLAAARKAKPGLPSVTYTKLARSVTVTQYGEKGERLEGVALCDEDGLRELVLTHEVRWSIRPVPQTMGPKAEGANWAGATAEVAPADAAGDS
jgi:hypothetical protein